MDEDASRVFCSVPGPLQTVRRADYWEVILDSKFQALLTSVLATRTFVTGLDGCLLIARRYHICLCTDGDPLSLSRTIRMLRYPSCSTVKVSEVACWPCGVYALVMFSAFSTLRWPEGRNEMGGYGGSYLALLIL